MLLKARGPLIMEHRIYTFNVYSSRRENVAEKIETNRKTPRQKTLQFIRQCHNIIMCAIQAKKSCLLACSLCGCYVSCLTMFISETNNMPHIKPFLFVLWV